MIDIVIPVHELKRRGVQRIIYGVQSLSLQMTKVGNVYVMDSTHPSLFNALNRFLRKHKFVQHINMPSNEFNKCKLLNGGIRLSKSKYVMCVDADNLYRKDFLTMCGRYASEDTMVLKAVDLLPKLLVTPNRVTHWSFPRCKPYVWKGKTGENLANGGVQLATRRWWLDNLHDERMTGWGAMDNLQVEKAKRSLKIVWMKESEVLHQYHSTEKNKNGFDKRNFDRNQRILSEYIKTH